MLPIAFQQLMLSAVSAADAIMLGFISQDSLSAISLAGQIQFIFNLFLAAMTIGLSIFAAQYYGKKDMKAVNQFFGMILHYTEVVAILFCVAALCIPRELMKLFTKDANLITMGARYLQIIAVTYLLIGVSQVYLCILKNTGHTLKSTVISCVSVVVNILLNAVFIFGLCGAPALGIAGAAIATVISRVIECIWVVIDSYSKGRSRPKLKYILHSDSIYRKDFWKHTSPVLANEIAWGGGFTMFSVIMGHLGTDAVAANSIANIVKNLLVCFAGGLGAGGGIMVGNELGAGQLKKARCYGDRLCKLSVIAGLLTGGALLLLTPCILHFTKLSQTAQEYLSWMLCICCFNIIGKSVNGTTIGGIFCAGGDSKFGFLCDTITLWVVILPLGALAAFGWNLAVPVVYLILNLDEVIKLPAVFRHYKKYRWIKDLTRES